MTVITGQSITAPANGSLKLKGIAYGWCGFCGCSGAPSVEASIDLGTATAGETYTIINKGSHQNCYVIGANGKGVILKVTNTAFDDSTTGGNASQWSPGTYYLEFTYADLKYDCLNGNCTVSTQYNTPGLYTSLKDCQAVCANGGACAEGKKCVDPTTFCPDGKICIDQGEFASIEALISKIGSEVC